VVSSLHHVHPRCAALALALLGATALAGCVGYAPAPIDPARVQTEFGARSLEDPDLVAFARSSLPEGVRFPPPSWDLDSLTVVALHDHHDVALAEAELESVEAGTITASARPNPTLVLDPQYVANAGGGLQSWVLGALVDVKIETAGKRDLRSARAERMSDAAELGLYEAAWRVRSRLRSALLESVILERELVLLREEERLRRESLDLLEQRLAQGQISRPELAAAEIDHSQVELEIRSLESAQRESRARLASALGVPERALEGRSLAWTDSQPSLVRAVLEREQADALLGRLDLRRSLAEYAVSEAELEIEIAKQYPDVSLAPGYSYDQGAHKILFGFALPLPIFDHNEGPIAEAEARRHTAEVKFEALQARAIGEIEAARARLAGAEAELAEADSVLARYRERERQVGRAVELGAEDRLALSEVEIQRAVFARAELAAKRKVEAALGDLEDALQRPLMGEAAVIERARSARGPDVNANHPDREWSIDEG
jgi:outer membrane protein TolC